MNILGKKISSKTENNINALTHTFKKPIIYYKLSNDDTMFGCCDGFNTSNEYHVGLKLNLPQHAFECNLLHELLHINQSENGFPAICNKTTTNFINEQEWFSMLGRQLQVTTLDADVVQRLNNLGYSSEYFIESRLDVVKNLFADMILNIGDKYNFALFSTQFILLSLISNKEQFENVERIIINKSIELYDKSMELTAKISEIGYDTPIGATLSNCELLNELNLWSQYYIYFKEQKIRNYTEAIKLKI